MAILTRKNLTENWTSTYNGMVVGKFTRDLQVMSDMYERAIYAIVYDIVQDTVREIYVCSEWGYETHKVEVDASPALMEKYVAHLVNEKRHQKAVQLTHEHNARWIQAHHMNVTLSQYKRLKRLGSNSFDILYILLGTKNFRSQFRANLAQQVRDWLADENPKYNSPLSPRQWECADNRPAFARKKYYY